MPASPGSSLPLRTSASMTRSLTPLTPRKLGSPNPFATTKGNAVKSVAPEQKLIRRRGESSVEKARRLSSERTSAAFSGILTNEPMEYYCVEYFSSCSAKNSNGCAPSPGRPQAARQCRSPTPQANCRPSALGGFLL